MTSPSEPNYAGPNRRDESEHGELRRERFDKLMSYMVNQKGMTEEEAKEALRNMVRGGGNQFHLTATPQPST